MDADASRRVRDGGCQVKTRIILFFTGCAISCLLFWLGGYSFNERGEASVWCAVCSLLLGFFLATYPGLDRDRNGGVG